ncbi:MAG: DUF2344 domain-containing protein [Firmicutes bacterium]|nr:DUF2344 domain-containing protein [Bacillota bacterium]
MSSVIRFQFAKGPEVQFLSHLDLVRTMERALRRAGLPIAYSEGFTPRPIMSFSYALPVGILSEAEYGDYTFAEALAPEEFVARYNQHLPTGFRVLQAECLPSGTPTLQRVINAARWRIVLPATSLEAERIAKRWEELQLVDSFKVQRETKKGSREVDLRPLLFEVVQISQTPTATTFECLCAVGSENLRMDELGSLLGFSHLEALITRIGQYHKVGNSYVPPVGNRGSE